VLVIVANVDKQSSNAIAEDIIIAGFITAFPECLNISHDFLNVGYRYSTRGYGQAHCFI
jgi:hypothetical protein